MFGKRSLQCFITSIVISCTFYLFFHWFVHVCSSVLKLDIALGRSFSYVKVTDDKIELSSYRWKLHGIKPWDGNVCFNLSQNLYFTYRYIIQFSLWCYHRENHMYYYNIIGKIRNIDKLKKYTLNVRQLHNNNLHEKTYLYQLYPFAMINIFNIYNLFILFF